MHIEDHHGSNSDPTVEEGNKHEIVGGDTEVKDNSSTQQIVSAIDDSDAKNDASKKISGTNNDKQVVRGVDKEDRDYKADQSEEEEPAETNIPDSQTNGSNDDARIHTEKMPHEEKNGDNKKIDIEKGDVVSKASNAHDLSIVQETTTSSYREKSEKMFKSKKRVKRHIKKGHETTRKLACDDEPKAQADLRGHTCVSRETSENDKKNIKVQNKDNAEHIVEGRNEAKRKQIKTSA